MMISKFIGRIRGTRGIVYEKPNVRITINEL